MSRWASIKKARSRRALGKEEESDVWDGMMNCGGRRLGLLCPICSRAKIFCAIHLIEVVHMWLGQAQEKMVFGPR